MSFSCCRRLSVDSGAYRLLSVAIHTFKHGLKTVKSAFSGLILGVLGVFRRFTWGYLYVTTPAFPVLKFGHCVILLFFLIIFFIYIIIYIIVYIRDIMKELHGDLKIGHLTAG